ncbi:hypothetical protein KIN20_012728 [Parelaphostrongylus tenuis]|uniref:Uncharacterized protein n=1 Tax=Parelaphostrongylus tenuis TaxID=148309 RepID=A0AAD5MWL2_PARTN|nr:hypothetical protein KIN20_012728 [Parelaphostrongylus tenuis]
MFRTAAKEPNANDTMEFLKKLYGLEKEINDELTLSTKPSAHTLEEMKDINKAKENRNKRQAYRDESYPVYLWSDGVTYSFHNTSSAIMLLPQYNHINDRYHSLTTKFSSLG